MDNLHQRIETKYTELGENPQHYLSGLLHSKPLTYWDYVEVDTLLTLQKPRTDFPDEMIFIMYHQLTEILLRLIRHELEQVTAEPWTSDAFPIEKMTRINRYIGICISSFSVMGKGMDPEQYNTFRLSLTPASGFQCAQFRLIEFMMTDIHHFLAHRFKEELKKEDDLDHLFEHLYWQDAGKNRQTGEKSLMLRLFEEKYLDDMKKAARDYRERNIGQLWDRWSAGRNQEETTALKAVLKETDQLFNVQWPLVHLETAEAYLDSGKKTADATGGSNWKRYLHPAYQRRMFFPQLLTEAELSNWGKK